MKNGSLAFFLFSFLLFYACTQKEQVLESIQNGCQKYVELNYSNYDSLRMDPLSIREVKIEDDCLHLTLQYGGGCAEHQIDLALILPECGTPPLPPPTFEIRHDSNGDVCKALITQDYSFDLSGIRKQGKSSIDFILSYQKSPGTFISTTYTYKY